MKLQSDRKIRKRRVDSQLNPYSSENQEYLQPSFHNMKQSSSSSISNIPKKKLKLMPIKQSLIKDKNEEIIKKGVSKRRAKSHLNTDISELKEQISKIRHQIRSKKSKIQVPNYIENVDEQAMYSPMVQHKKQLFKPFWNEAQNKSSPKKYKPMGINSNIYKKQRELTMVSESESEEQQYVQSSHYFPIIQKSRLKETFFRNKGKSIYSSASYNNSSPKREKLMNSKKNGRIRQNLRNFRKVAHAVLFTIYLRKFNESMRERRKSSFVKFINSQLTPKLLEIKELIIQDSKPFFNTLSQQCQFDFRPGPIDDSKLRKQKLKFLKKLVIQQIQCLKEVVGTIVAQKQKYTQLFYLLCKHGSYSNLHSIYTPQEINLLCVSQFYSYLRADKYLQQSALASLLMIKLFLFNVLFDQNLILNLYGSNNMGFMGKTIQLIGNIFYQLFIDIQDELLEKAPPLYKVGNWQTLKNKINLKLATNMTVREGFFQKNQLISGLQDHKTIIEMFETKSMLSQKQELKQIIRKLYILICNHHKKVREKSFMG